MLLIERTEKGDAHVMVRVLCTARDSSPGIENPGFMP